MLNQFRVLIVDDSTVFRSQVRAALEGIKEVELVGSASNGRLGLEVLKVKQVDLVISDIEMPEMTGLELLAEISRLNIKTKVLVFSAHSKQGAEATLSALSLGAADFLPKPDASMAAPGTLPSAIIRAALLPKVMQFLSPKASYTEAVATPLATLPVPSSYPKMNWNLFNPKVLVIASSTGGPAALEKFFSHLKGPFTVPVLIAQHMPPLFTATLAERLTKISGIDVKEGKPGDVLQAGKVYIAPGDYHMVVTGTADQARVELNQDPLRNSVRPCANFLFESAVSIFKNQTLGVVFTGMGADGKDGAVEIKKAGGAILIQDKESCVVFGMPGAVFDVQAYDRMGNVENLVEMISELGLCQKIARAS